jgi:hypothetical protein
MYQLDVAGSANVSNPLLSQTHSNSGNFQSSYIQSATLSNTGNLIVEGTFYPAAISMSTNPLYIQNGNAGITYANVSGTGQTIDGTAICGWQGGVLGYTANGSNFATGRNGINGTLSWNYSNVGIRNSNPQYALDINGTCVATQFAGSLGWGYLTSVPALCSNTSPDQVLYGSNTSYYCSNALASIATSANYTWASNALRSNVNDVSFSSNVVVGLGIIANSLTTNDLFVNNTISAQAGIS